MLLHIRSTTAWIAKRIAQAGLLAKFGFQAAALQPFSLSVPFAVFIRQQSECQNLKNQQYKKQ
jgi:hypothetical protein